MDHTPKKKNKLPKDFAERTDHEIMELLFGKQVMKAVDKIVDDRSQGFDSK